MSWCARIRWSVPWTIWIYCVSLAQPTPRRVRTTMPCNWGRSIVVSMAIGLGLFMLLAAGGAAYARQEPTNPHAQQSLAANAIDRWNQMSPEERERELAKLPPARAKLIRQRIRRYNQMHPDEQQALRERYQTFSQLPAEKQQTIRARLREFRQLPQERRP